MMVDFHEYEARERIGGESVWHTIPQHPAPKDPPIWFTVALIAIVMVILILGLALLFSTIDWVNQTQTEFDRRDAIIQACIDSERYSRAECIVIGGNQ